jgi:hypothetical protein
MKIGELYNSSLYGYCIEVLHGIFTELILQVRSSGEFVSVGEKIVGKKKKILF